MCYSSAAVEGSALRLPFDLVAIPPGLLFAVLAPVLVAGLLLAAGLAVVAAVAETMQTLAAAPVIVVAVVKISSMVHYHWH